MADEPWDSGRAQPIETADWEVPGGQIRSGIVPAAAEAPAGFIDDEPAAAAPSPLAGLPDAEPLSRLSWTESPDTIDAGETLREWAEGAGLIVAFGIVSLWLLRQWLWSRNQPVGPANHLRAVESISLPQRCRIHLLDVDGRQVLVASDAGGVKSVTVLPDRFDNALNDAGVDDSAPSGAREGPAAGLSAEAWSALRETRLT